MIVFWGEMRGLCIIVGFLKLSLVIVQEDFRVNGNVMLDTGFWFCLFFFLLWHLKECSPYYH